MKLLIISHTPHYLKHGSFYGWGSTVREIDHLASLFDEILHLAPCHSGDPVEVHLPYTASNVSVMPVNPAGGDRPRDKFALLKRLPEWTKKIREAMQDADCIQIRCPAAISLLALFLVRFGKIKKPCWVKYAGNWTAKKNVPLSFRFQRWLLKKNFHRGITTINGEYNQASPSVIPFTNPSLTHEVFHQASVEIETKPLIQQPVHLLYVGRLEKAKGTHLIVPICRELALKGIDFQFSVVGGGEMEKELQEAIHSEGLDKKVRLKGWQPMEKIWGEYQQAHLFILPSFSEGWPKVLSESLCFGTVPIASAISVIPLVLGKNKKGLVVPPGDVMGFVKAIQYYLEHPSQWQRASLSGHQDSLEYTYGEFLKKVKSLFNDFWQISLKNG